MNDRTTRFSLVSQWFDTEVITDCRRIEQPYMQPTAESLGGGALEIGIPPEAGETDLFERLEYVYRRSQGDMRAFPKLPRMHPGDIVIVCGYITDDKPIPYLCETDGWRKISEAEYTAWKVSDQVARCEYGVGLSSIEDAAAKVGVSGRVLATA